MSRPALLCHRKQRFLDRAVALEFARAMVARTNDHPHRNARLAPYWCSMHACWHLGHQRRVFTNVPRVHDYNLIAAIGLVNRLRDEAVREFGANRQQKTWDGVRALCGVLKHLQR